MSISEATSLFVRQRVVRFLGDKTSMRHQTHYQLKQKMWLEPFRDRQEIGGNELIHSGLFQVYHLGFGSS